MVTTESTRQRKWQQQKGDWRDNKLEWQQTEIVTDQNGKLSVIDSCKAVTNDITMH